MAGGSAGLYDNTPKPQNSTGPEDQAFVAQDLLILCFSDSLAPSVGA